MNRRHFLLGLGIASVVAFPVAAKNLRILPKTNQYTRELNENDLLNDITYNQLVDGKIYHIHNSIEIPSYIGNRLIRGCTINFSHNDTATIHCYRNVMWEGNYFNLEGRRNDSTKMIPCVYVVDMPDCELIYDHAVLIGIR